MNDSLNTRQVTVLPALAPAMPPRAPAAPAVIVRAALAPSTSSEIRPVDVARAPQSQIPIAQSDGYRPGLVVSLVGHITASLAGLAIAYHFLCWLRPAEFNWGFLHSVSAVWLNW